MMTRQQLAILLWKNYCIRRCRLSHSIWEIISGIVIFAVIFFSKKTLVYSEHYMELGGMINKVYMPQSEFTYSLMGSILNEVNINKIKIGDVITRAPLFKMNAKHLTNYRSGNNTNPNEQKPKFKTDLVTIKHFVLLCTIMAPLPFYLYKISTLVDEKRTGMKHLMQLSGVSDHLWRLSHLIDTIFMGLLYSILVTILFKIPNGSLLPNSNFVIIAFTILFHFVNVSSLAFITSSISQDYQHAEGWALMLYLFFNLINTCWFSYESKSFVHLYILGSLLPHAPMYLFWVEIITLEFNGYGLNFSNIWLKHSEYCLPVCVLWLLFAIHFVIIMSIAWYLDKVRPGKYGVAKDWTFIFGKHYWKRYQKKKKKVSFHVTCERNLNIVRDCKYFQSPKQNTEVAIKVINVKKVFKTKRKSVEVLKNINLEVYKGEITVLLGPNECGKTTLLSIISGMYSATSGSVYVNGLDIATRAYEVSKDLGLCPQTHNTFKYLTIEENVMFFDMLKGTSKYEAKINAQRLMIDLRINHKAHYYSHQLSTGMRRCLQIACAISGGADILVLDEPTTGMDYEAKHSLWDVLLLLRGNKTILMSTTCIEEADALGDSIAVINSGLIRCHGTTMFLKDAFGVGFNLTIEFIDEAQGDEISSIFEEIQNSEIKFVDHKVLAVTLPTLHFTSYEDVFDEIERRKEELGITRMCIAISLEEMYMRFIQDDTTSTVSVNYIEDNVETIELLKGFKLLKQQFVALLHRNFVIILSKKLQFFILQFISPMIGIMFITLATNKSFHVDKFREEYPINLENKIGRTSENIVRELYFNANVNLPKDALLTYLWILYLSLLIVLPLVPSIWIATYEFRSTIRFSHLNLGCPAWLHWLSRFLVDYIIFLLIVPPTVMLSCYCLETDHTINQTDYVSSLMICIMVYGPAFLSHMYCISFLLTNNNSISQVYIIILCCSLVVKLIADLFTFKFLLLLLSLFNPVFTFTYLISILSWVARFNAYCKLNHNFCPNLQWKAEPIFSPQLCCDNERGTTIYTYFPSKFYADVFLLILLFDTVVYTILLFQLQNSNVFKIYNYFTNTLQDYVNLYRNQNVIYEKYYVSDKIRLLRTGIVSREDSDILLVSDLHKSYSSLTFGTKKVYSVRGVSFAVKRGTCLVLLGSNGCGKTTTLNIIAGNIIKSRGSIYANGYFINENRLEYLKSISAGLKEGSLDGFKSAFDNLVFHAKLIGMPPATANKQAVYWLRYMGVTSVVNKKVSSLSAGCIGRLKLAIVMMTSRSLVLLDEPVEVQDVVAKMFVTRALRRALKQKKAVIVATQTMNWKEVEAMSDRIAIMHSGELAVIGSAEDIKSYYACGYIARIKLKVQTASIVNTEDQNSTNQDQVRTDYLNRVNELRNAFAEEFPGCSLITDHLRMLYYHIKVSTELSQFTEIFHTLQRLRADYSDVFLDYALNEVSLDEILAQFRRKRQF